MRAAGALVVAAGLGVALSVILTIAGLRGSGVPGLLGAAVLIAACVYIGWLVAQLTSAPVSLVAAPIVGDAFEIFVIIFAATGAFGALLGQVPWLRIRAAIAARTGLWLTGAALVLSATTLVSAAAIGA